ncbi:Hint domain-containing protein [Phyllobacterium sp. 628]|uniref:Hint domain-containing protein n=1 Tax=Phyllobacterium sp. 628 TaxID=2718938 RepID=UPI0016628380|nr:Hint domain-containing protein [Phyllobacterium sp. 628]QND52563.1 Hint domain-containing protein [Phyllobacterium sp. 628]
MVTTTWIGPSDNMQGWDNPRVDPVTNPWSGNNWDAGGPNGWNTAVLNNTSTTAYIVTVGSLILNNSALLVYNSITVSWGSPPGTISGGLIYLYSARFIAGPGTIATGTVKMGEGSSYEWYGANSAQIIQMPAGNYPHSSGATFTFYTQFDGIIESFYFRDTIICAINGATISGMDINGHTLTFITNMGNYTLNFGNGVDMADLAFDPQTGKLTTTQVDPNAPCFASGTLIRTERGDIAVETLKVGDMAITVSGEHRPIIWLGHCTLVRGKSPNFDTARPVRIQAGAFGEQMPYVDLWLSPGHAVCVRLLDEVLIPAGYLINGATIAQVNVDEVTYWHVELDSHDILIANGLPTESYLDCGTRACFEGTGDTLDPERKLATPEEYCRPLILDGLTVEAVARRLRARAEQLGWVRTTDMDIHLVADGVRIDPDLDEGMVRFLIPARTQDVRLVSETFIPSEWSDTGDERRLGIAVYGLHIDDGLRCSRDISIDDPRLVDGFHHQEAADGKSWRWTNGSLNVPSELWADCKSHVFLRVNMDNSGHPHWVGSSKTKAQLPKLIDTGRASFVPLRAA